MRIFVTGATGFIGTPVVRQLLDAGHQVVGLARNDQAAETLKGWGAEVRRGDLADPDGMADAAKASDGVIHLAFIHDFANFAASAQADVRAVKAMTAALEGSGKPLVIASGTMMVSHGRPATEEMGPPSPDGPRAGSELSVVAAAERGVRGVVVRLSPAVHDTLRQGLVTTLIPIAREKGVSPYVGDGANRWPAVHRLDAARLFVLGLERAKPGSRLHAVDEEGVTTRAIAEAIGKRLGVPSRSMSPDEAQGHFGMPFAYFAAVDNPATSTITRQALGWTPTERGLLADIAECVLDD